MTVDYERRDAVAILTLNRPDALNALSPEMLDDLEAALESADEDASIGAIVLTGAGPKAFCAGADIGHMRTAGALEARDFAARGHAVAARIERLGTPSVAAVNGYALGGGCEIALACDVRIASDRARFAQPEVALGILPGWGGTQRLARVTSLGFAKEMILTGRHVMADEAQRAGLVNHVHPGDELLDKAVELAGQIARHPGWATAAAKTLCNLALGGGDPSPYRQEIDTFALAFTTPDQREGMDAFFEKRPARFAHREEVPAR
ncbi:MAG: enoyl-CoA hydratase-related protein [Thermoleophilia bacterium]